MIVRNSCQGGRGANEQVCRQREVDCLVTCPGAIAGDLRAEDLQAQTVPIEPEATTESAPAASPVRRPSCVASELPEWQGADAATKKRLMEQCRAPAPSP